MSIQNNFFVVGDNCTIPITNNEICKNLSNGIACCYKTVGGYAAYFPTSDGFVQIRITPIIVPGQSDPFGVFILSHNPFNNNTTYGIINGIINSNNVFVTSDIEKNGVPNLIENWKQYIGSKNDSTTHFEITQFDKHKRFLVRKVIMT